MDGLTIDLLGTMPLTEAEIQARSQANIAAAGWAAWRRERALRLAIAGDDAELTAFNAVIAVASAAVDAARADSTLLAETLAYEAATVRLALPEYAGEDEATAALDAAERASAAALVAAAAEVVVDLSIARAAAAGAVEGGE